MGYSCSEPTYSEWTPGWEGDMYCMKSHWKYDPFNDGKNTLRKKIYMAVACEDFKPERE
jgi:hypothetical protein